MDDRTGAEEATDIQIGTVYSRNATIWSEYDVLANPDQCALDAPLMKTLLVNTVRVYTVNNTLNHTACMNTFEEHGIYVWISLNTFETRISNVSPLNEKSSPCAYWR